MLTTTHLCEVNERGNSETWDVRPGINPFKPAPRSAPAAAPSLLLRDSAKRAGAWSNR